MALFARGAGAASVKRTLMDLRDWSGLSQGDDNAQSQRWDPAGRMTLGADSLYTPDGALVPTLTHVAAIGMRAYQAVSNNNQGGFFNNRHGIPLSRRYGNPALPLPVGGFGPPLRWRFSAVLWTETPQPLALVHFGLVSGNNNLASSGDNTGYEIRATDNGVWECRRRLTMGGAINTFVIPGAPSSLDPTEWEWRYREGAEPVLELRRNGSTLLQFSGQGDMPSLNTNVVFPAHMIRWFIVNTGVVNALHRLVGGRYLIDEQ